jgi:hypothetical protein
MLKAGLSIPAVFLVVGLANALMTAYIFWVVPEYWKRFKLLLGWRIEVSPPH